MYKKLEVSRSVSILFYYCPHPAPTRNIARYGPALRTYTKGRFNEDSSRNLIFHTILLCIFSIKRNVWKEVRVSYSFLSILNIFRKMCHTWGKVVHFSNFHLASLLHTSYNEDEITIFFGKSHTFSVIFQNDLHIRQGVYCLIHFGLPIFKKWFDFNQHSIFLSFHLRRHLSSRHFLDLQFGAINAFNRICQTNYTTYTSPSIIIKDLRSERTLLVEL